MWKNTAMMTVATLMLTGCGSLTTLSTPPTVNQPKIERALLQLCQKLPLMDEGKIADRFYLAKTVIGMYGDCRRKQEALADSVNAIEGKRLKNEIRN
ncbi:hypothetical protein [Candidatus Vondammii sp. HM_W22]|uniref:hypothetical protein n=1 Tax=Candidatus Vondammii sp. HM_W22 TaxID=2687299 RepID=UPI002E7AB3A0|nr:hypothetical protein [Candidatus Vondammii sp. HM_W22]